MMGVRRCAAPEKGVAKVHNIRFNSSIDHD